MTFDVGNASIRTRLLALVLAVFVPAAAMLGWFLAAAAAEARNTAYAKVKVIADITASNLRLVLADTESMLTRLAALPQVQAMDPEHCDPLIKQLVALQPAYTQLAVRDLAGKVICSHLPNPVRQYQPDQHPWFFEGVRSGGLFVTDAALGPVSRRWATAVMLPLQDAQGKRAGAVMTFLDLAQLNQRLLGAVPESDVVAVLDRQDKFLLRSADPAKWIGKASQAAANEAVRGQAAGQLTTTGSDGVRRLFAFTTMPATGWRIVAGVPEAEVLAAYFAQRNLTLALSGVMAALALLLARRLAASIARPTQQLAQTAARMAGGDLQARAVAAGPRELRDLGTQFNQMLEVQVAANAALIESEARYRALVDSAPFGIAVHQQGCLVFVNPAAVAILGATAAGELLGRPIMDFIHPDSRQSVRERVQAIIDRGESATRRLQKFVQLDGSVIDVEVQGAAVTFQGAPAVQNSLQDVTERRQAQQALETVNRELTRSNAELQEFAYVASHDLQEPLRTVSSCVQLLQKRYAGQLDGRADEFIAHAVGGSVRMQALIDDLLLLSRVSLAPRMHSVIDSAAALEVACANLAVAIAQSSAQISHDALPRVQADPVQLAQLLQNLIGNALKFRSNQPAVVHVGAHREGAEWVLSVADQGIGIEPQYFSRIFALFKRLHTRDEYAGTGIGLTICKKIVERHGGRIWVASVMGQGSTFFFTLPTGGQPASAKPDRNPP